MWWLWTVGALASPCSDTSGIVERAWAAFDDAEVELAEQRVDEAIAALYCQERLVSTEELSSLYSLDVLLDVTTGDEAGARHGLERLIELVPDAMPEPSLGPQVGAMFEEVRASLGNQVHQLSLGGVTRAWIDGRSVVRGAPLEVVAGLHLVQVQSDSGWFSRGVRVESSGVVDLGEQGVEVLGRVPAVADGLETESRRSRSPHARRRVAMLSTGGASLALGGAALGVGFALESRFLNSPYDAPSYGGCTLVESCYADERESAVRRDVAWVRGLYGAGYALSAVGVGLFGTELFLLPTSGGGSGVGIRGRW